jgi:hypothetical protein
LAEQPPGHDEGATSGASREQACRRVGDRETLELLPSGLEIVRCRKHEAISFAGMSRQEISRRTDKRAGSKFTAAWSLARYVDWLAEQLSLLGWDADTGPADQDVVLPEVVGVSNGQAVSTIHIVSDGRYVHAYPARDA